MEIWQRDYSRGMAQPQEMTQTQSSSDVKKQLLKRIAKINENLKAKLVQNISILSMCIMLAFGLSSCNKNRDFPQPEPQPIEQKVTQYFGLTTTKESEINAKNYDPNTFVVQYSDVQYMLTISNAQNTYHKLCSVNELLAGTVTVTMIVGNYNVDYQPILDPDQPYTSTLNVSIHMTGIAFDGSPKILQGTLFQSLIIMDLGGISSVTNLQNIELPFIHKMPEDFWYAYTNQPFHGRLYNNMGQRVAEGITIDPLALGKLFWVIPSLNITYELQIPSLETIQVPVTIQ